MAPFADLGDHYPGSKQKRRAVASKSTPAPQTTRWDDHPLWVPINGTKHEFFYIGALAEALGRRPNTIRKWLNQGVIPPARYRTSNPDVRASRRLWTRAQIEGIVRIAREEGLTPGRTVSGTEFTARVKELFRVLKDSEP